MLDRYKFEILSYLEKKGKMMNMPKFIADEIRISNNNYLSNLNLLVSKNLIRLSDNKIMITQSGINALEPYRVKRAVIMGAGFGSRMMPATEVCPKPMVKVNGKRIIETQLDALINVGIKDITIVRGYQREKYNELLIKYPFLKFIDNDDYDKTNNISSVMKALDKIKGPTYLNEADLYITNPDVITKYQYTSNILGSYSLETDDWSFRMKDGHIVDYQQGNTYCYNYYGISYWTASDCDKLRRDWSELYSTEEGKQLFWEFIPLKLRHDNYQVEIRQCAKRDIMEIDNYFELVALDNSYPKINSK
ncbi:phosphocholine cytidylyltransferase family protein [Limosilactobacillus reuteri]|uniref:phosphocholine cytidylyltransferase family protein n=1 Tax=Limosilactobacillus reuteri TaxID=1598 RepID=UPI001F4E51A6|nr:phosphocholine cytidylyltransferase family protein [Limosilactobacillus reuteri]MCH9394799.1 phosphocholine cytidylyltransferase family protein [Limosilactobacillus reuteri]